MPSVNRAYRSLGLGVLALLGASAAVQAATHANQPPIAASQSSNTSALNTIVVTGTRATGRTQALSLAPVDVLTAAELSATGAPDLDSALRTLLPSFNFPQPPLDSDTDATQPAQLRGLSPDEVLVLIDGKRLHTTAQAMISAPLSIGRGSSPVDLSAIPMNAVQRVEVLRDGAAAQYGSDAIAGVINIILKKGARHGSLDATYGQRYRGEGRTGELDANGGVPLGAHGWLRGAVELFKQGGTQYAGPDLRYPAKDGYPADPRYGTPVVHYGQIPQTSERAAFNGQYRLSPQSTLYGFSVLNHRRIGSSGAFDALSTYDGGPFSAGRTSAAAIARYPAGFLPIKHDQVFDDTEVLGVRGKWLGWHYDLSGNTGGNLFKPRTVDSFNFSLGAASPTRFNLGALQLRQTVASAAFNRDYPAPWPGDLDVAWGLAYRHEHFSISPGDPASYAGAGGEWASGFTPADASSHARYNVAEYIDLTADFGQRLSAGFAARHENYSDFGGTTAWKLSGRFAVTPVLAVRSTVSTGFRAPSLQQEYFSSTARVFDDPAHPAESVLIRTFPVSDPAARALGAQPLKPETSVNYSAGLVFTPRVGPYTTLDVYEIDIDDRIILSGDLTGPAVQAYLTSQGISPDVGGGRFFTNAVATRTRGLDLVSAWPLELHGSRLKLTAGVNWNHTQIRSIAPNPPQLGLAGLSLPVIDRTERGRITVMSPATKAFIAANWQWRRWTIHGQVTRYGNWQYWAETPAGDQHYGARFIPDVAVSYALTHWVVTVGGNDFANVHPSKNNAATSFGGQQIYPEASPFGFSGAFWYARLAYRW